jgi:hypothetical protein
MWPDRIGPWGRRPHCLGGGYLAQVYTNLHKSGVGRSLEGARVMSLRIAGTSGTQCHSVDSDGAGASSVELFSERSYEVSLHLKYCSKSGGWGFQVRIIPSAPVYRISTIIGSHFELGNKTNGNSMWNKNSSFRIRETDLPERDSNRGAMLAMASIRPLGQADFLC